MKHIDVKEIISAKEYVGKQVTVCGWVRTSRNSKSVAFVELNDGTSLKNVQVVVEKGEGDYKEPRVGMALKVTGTVVEGRNNTVEIKPAKVADYQICVKIKDENGSIAKKYFDLKVNPAE